MLQVETEKNASHRSLLPEGQWVTGEEAVSKVKWISRAVNMQDREEDGLADRKGRKREENVTQG